MAETISRKDLLHAMTGDNPPVIVDVRSGPEYRSAHIPGAVHIPFFSVFSHRDRLPDDRRKPLVLTCEHGPRASVARLLLWTIGYRKVVYLEGHMSAWKERRLPTV